MYRKSRCGTDHVTYYVTGEECISACSSLLDNCLALIIAASRYLNYRVVKTNCSCLVYTLYRLATLYMMMHF